MLGDVLAPAKCVSLLALSRFARLALTYYAALCRADCAVRAVLYLRQRERFRIIQHTHTELGLNNCTPTEPISGLKSTLVGQAMNPSMAEAVVDHDRPLARPWSTLFRSLVCLWTGPWYHPWRRLWAISWSELCYNYRRKRATAPALVAVLAAACDISPAAPRQRLLNPFRTEIRDSPCSV